MPSQPERNLLVIIGDDLGRLVDKGELTERYYNPGDLFPEVTLLAVYNGKPVDPGLLQLTVGSARLKLVQVERPAVSATFGWNPRFLGRWFASALARIPSPPDLIRIHGIRHILVGEFRIIRPALYDSEKPFTSSFHAPFKR